MMELPAEFKDIPAAAGVWRVIQEGNEAKRQVEQLTDQVERQKKQLIQYRDRAQAAESQEIARLSKLGYIVLQEGGDITDSLNEPGFIKWVRWAMTDGWAELTAPTIELGWSGPEPNPAAEPIKAALGPLREELNLE